ncbi:SigE family RNA polymerase sigma factor [Streptomyces rubiginosohelvolus]|uniref:SigE family RNA polymerase sigma factor n=1 Tax=Streptomyces rubiginosohelvolus TaxID=67362 RepID=UPI003720B60A
MVVKSAAETDFEDFVRTQGPRLLRMAWLLTGDAHLAEDLLQTALAKVWPRWHVIAESQPEAYVRKTIIHTHATWWRRRWRGETPYEHLPEPTQTRVDPYAMFNLNRVLAAAVRRLPRRQRAVITLRYFEDLSVEETANVLGCKAGTVRSQSAKAVRVLRAVLAESHADLLWD